jgi:hypothetical protein
MLMRGTSLALRGRWVAHAFGRNPLIRRTDRLEAVAVLMVIVIALLAIPFAVHVGSETYITRMRTITEQAQTRHPVDAVAVGDSLPRVGPYTRPRSVRVQWREGTHTRTEVVAYPAVVKAGAPLTVWLDDTGKVVAAPGKPTAAKSDAAAQTAVVWLGAVALSVLVARALRRWLDRCRARAWERELQLLAHNDDGWANRHI